MQKGFDIFLIGVGGQGIGLLSEVLMRASDYAGMSVRAVDTHGLAQRGGIVSSHIRIGDRAYSPLIMERSADMVIALERNEALRGVNEYLRNGGLLVYYDTLWQPLSVRLGKDSYVTGEKISSECQRRNIRDVRVFKDNLPDARMQNVALLGTVAGNNMVPGINLKDYENAISDLLDGNTLMKNLELFHSLLNISVKT